MGAIMREIRQSMGVNRAENLTFYVLQYAGNLAVSCHSLEYTENNAFTNRTKNKATTTVTAAIEKIIFTLRWK